jgi:molecular chaperone HscC
MPSAVSIDANGEVDVKALSTGERRKIVIEENPGGLAQQEIDERLAGLAALKIAPRELSENRALLARAERLHEETLGEARQAIARAIPTFDAALQDQQPEAIAEHRRKSELLDQIDHEFRL